MLRSLIIQNYALIDDLKVEFDSGLNILTGETGSGKSIILGALGLLVGERADLNVLASADKKCFVEGEFQLSQSQELEAFFKANEIDFDEQSFIRREILPSGRSRAFINDTPVKLSLLKDLGIRLIDIHSQHQTIQINDSEFQLSIYDNFIGISAELNKYRTLFSEYQKLQMQLRSLESEQAERLNEEDFYKFQLRELTEIDLENIDEKELEEEFNQLTNAEDIGQSLTETANYLGEGDFPITEMLKRASSALSNISKYSDLYSDLRNRIESSKIEIDDILSEVQKAHDLVEVNPERLTIIEEKRNNLFRLEQKHQAKDLRELQERKREIENNLDTSNKLEEEIERLKGKIASLNIDLSSRAQQLNKVRTANAQEFSKKVLETLVLLNLKHAKFEVQVNQLQDLGRSGKDSVEMKFSANPDRELRSLRDTASGGELSRLMLALKKMAAESISSTLIFDEIDSGVSGEVANAMGAIIKNMSENVQTICITHLPQIASKGEAHFKVSKTIEKGITSTNIKRLNKEERIVEIAQMLSGAKTTDAALANARDMLYLN